MKHIVTIQHTQSEQHCNGMVGSWADWDLTLLGVEQAKRMGQRLSQELREARYVLYCSDLLRARHTAERVGDCMGLRPIPTASLREWNYGEAVGKSKEWARQHAKGGWDGIDDKPYAGCESKREVWQRLHMFLEQVMARGETHVMLVSHSGTLSVFYALWLGLEVEALNRCALVSSAGGVSFMREEADRRRVLVRLNDLSYIRE